KGMYTVDDAQSKLKFSKIFTDVKGYALAVYFCELLRQLAPINDKSEEFLALALNSLHLINEQKKPLLLIKSVFELRLLSYSGYMPDIVACSECGEFTKDDVYFDFRKSTIMCKKCAAKLSVRCNCSSAVLMSMRHIVYSEPSKIFSFTLSETQLELLTKLSERYVTEQIEKELQTLRFFKSL
ncbi:MAG: DNA repair protein RecO, partial [Oscillospiraceae bacterium]